MTVCPTAAQLAAFIAGNLTEAAAAALEAHLDVCEACRRGLAALVRDLAPRGTLGRYRIDGLVGGGGMGIVYLGFDPELRRAVAIKVVRPGGDEDTARMRVRLSREAEGLAALNHRHVCQVYDIGTDGDELWMAMELVDGAPLRRWLAAEPPAIERVRVLVEIADALAAAHAAGLCHRDIKPDNVMVARDGRAVLTDFGLVGRRDSGHSTALAGTLAYLAPELLEGAPPDAPADQYAFAVMAHEALHGARPRPRGVPANKLPVPLRAILQRALADDPRDRYPTMSALADALRAAARRRRRGMSVGVAVGGAALIAVIAIAIATVEPAPPAAVPPAPTAVPPRSAAAGGVGVRMIEGPADLRRVDVAEFWRGARAAARIAHPGIQLSSYSAYDVDDRGRTNVTKSGSVHARFAFVDPDPDGSCGIERAVGVAGGMALELDIDIGDCPAAPEPRCSLDEILARASELGLSAKVPGYIQYNAQGWVLQTKNAVKAIPDDCGATAAASAAPADASPTPAGSDAGPVATIAAGRPPPRLAAPADLRRVDVAEFWRSASAEVRRAYPGILFSSYWATHVDARGRANVADGGTVLVEFYFVDPDPESPCGIQYYVGHTEPRKYEIRPGYCSKGPGPAPRCTLDEILARASDLGGGHEVELDVFYYSAGSPGWELRIPGEQTPITIPDDCDTAAATDVER